MQNRRNKSNISISTFARLVRLEIKRRDPEHFNVAWIRRYVHTRPHDLMRKNGCAMANGEPVWEDLLELLPEQRQLWKYKQPSWGDVDKAMKEVLSMLESEQPETFGPKWIKERCQPAFVRIKKHLSSDWSKLKSRLPHRWRNRFTYMGVHF